MVYAMKATVTMLLLAQHCTVCYRCFTIRMVYLGFYILTTFAQQFLQR